MNDKTDLIEEIKALPGIDADVAKRLGVSVGLLRAMRQGRRVVSESTARKLGYERVTVYRPFQLQPAPDQPAPADTGRNYDCLDGIVGCPIVGPHPHRHTYDGVEK